MTNLKKSSGEGRSEVLSTGIVKKLIVLASALVVAVAASLPMSAQAASSSITQLEYLQWLVQLAGDAGQFSENTTANDYVNWARGKGMVPDGGWKLNGKLTKQVLAQTLAQFLSLNPGKSKDYLAALARNGIDLPDSEDISRQQIVVLVDGDLQPRTSMFRQVSPSKGNNGIGNGEDPPPPGWLNPRNPHFGDEQNDENAGPPRGRGPQNGQKAN